MAMPVERRTPDRLREEQRAEEHDEGRIGEEDQALELRGDVNEPEEVRVAREPIAEHADQRRAQHQTRESAARARCAAARATDSDADRRIERQRQEHAEREQRLRIDPLRIGELDEDRLGGEERRPERRAGIADPEARHGRGGGAGDDARRCRCLLMRSLVQRMRSDRGKGRPASLTRPAEEIQKPPGTRLAPRRVSQRRRRFRSCSAHSRRPDGGPEPISAKSEAPARRPALEHPGTGQGAGGARENYLLAGTQSLSPAAHVVCGPASWPRPRR